MFIAIIETLYKDRRRNEFASDIAMICHKDDCMATSKTKLFLTKKSTLWMPQEDCDTSLLVQQVALCKQRMFEVAHWQE